MNQISGINAYTDEQRLAYLAMSDRVSSNWLKVFGRPPEDKTFWDTGFWDLFTKLWRVGKEVKKTDAVGYITGKTTAAATKLLNLAIENKLITERDNPDDQRSSLVGLSDDTKQHLDEFFNEALKELEATVEIISEVV
jgi:hypothetical protein